MSEHPALHIRQYVPADLDSVQELFASGLIEFSGEAERGVRRYVENSLKDDMATSQPTICPKSAVISGWRNPWEQWMEKAKLLG